MPLFRKKPQADSTAPSPDSDDSELPPTGDPFLDLGDDPSYKLRRMRSWAVVLLLGLAVPAISLTSYASGYRAHKPAAATEDLARQGAPDYGCGLSRAWFTWDSDKPDKRGEALKVFNPSWDTRKGWNGQGKQTVSYTVSPQTQKVEGKDNEYEVTCGLFFEDPSIAPIFDKVRVLADGAGQYSPLSMPNVVSNPAAPVPDQALRDGTALVDAQAPAPVATPVTAQVKAYLTAWGKGDVTVMRGLSSTDFTPAPLSGSLSLDSAQDVKVYQTRDKSRTYAEAKIRWVNSSGAAMDASYRLDFVEKDGRWLVSKVDSTTLDSKAFVSSS